MSTLFGILFLVLAIHAEECVSTSPERPWTGTIRWEIEEVSKMTKKEKSSSTILVNGQPWHVIAYKRRAEDQDYMSVYLYGLENDSTMWSIDVSARFTILNNDLTNHIVKTYTKTFDHSTVNWGYSKFISWKQLVDDKKGYVVGDKITMEITITINDMKGIRRVPRFDFTNPNEPRHDATVVIGGKKIYVSKQYLSLHSPVFNDMFYNSNEKNRYNIEIDDVTYEDMIEALNVIYPTGKKITDTNAERLLSFGNEFEIKMIVDQVEHFLIESEEFSVAAKLKLSGKYRLVALEGACLDSLETIEDVTNLKKSEEYNQLSDETKLSLLQKIMNLAN